MQRIKEFFQWNSDNYETVDQTPIEMPEFEETIEIVVEQELRQKILKVMKEEKIKLQNKQTQVSKTDGKKRRILTIALVILLIIGMIIFLTVFFIALRNNNGPPPQQNNNSTAIQRY